MGSLTDADGMIDVGKVLAASAGLITATFFESLADLVTAVVNAVFVAPVEMFNTQMVSVYNSTASILLGTFNATIGETVGALETFGPLAFFLSILFVVAMAWLGSKAVSLHG